MKNIKEIWADDELNRQEEALFLQRYIENIYLHSVAKDTSFVLNINSEWGHGKSFFLQRLAEQLKQNHPVVFFDAWKNDFTEDALLSFVSVVCDDLSKQSNGRKGYSEKVQIVEASFKKIMTKALPILMAVLAKQLTGMTLGQLCEGNELTEDARDTASQLASVATSTLIKDFLERREGIEGFKNAISDFVNEVGKLHSIQLPICVIVDELDRCRPTYAIELLESIKHLFDVKGVVFLIATDTKQLSHSVKAVYGQEFSSVAYLKRFFSAEYQLSDPDCEKFSSYLFKEFKMDDRLFLPDEIEKRFSASRFFALVSRFFKLTARDQHQVYNFLVTLLLSTDKKVLQFPFILLLIILKHKFEAETADFFLTKNGSKLMTFFKDMKESGRIVNQPFQSYHYDSSRGQAKMTDLEKLFTFYLGGVFKEPRVTIIGPQEGWDHEIQIQASMSDVNELYDYYSLLAQAGRITSQV